MIFKARVSEDLLKNVEDLHEQADRNLKNGDILFDRLISGECNYLKLPKSPREQLF